MAAETVEQNPAKRADLVARSFRTLTEQELNVGCDLLDDAYYDLVGRYPQIKVKLTEEQAIVATDDRIFTRRVVKLLCAVVLRVIKNPDGKFEEEGDDYRYRRDQALSTGELYFSDDEINDLLQGLEGSNNAFTIRPWNAARIVPPLPEEAFWEPII